MKDKPFKIYVTIVATILAALIVATPFIITNSVNRDRECREQGGTPYRSLCLAPGVILEDVR